MGKLFQKKRANWIKTHARRNKVTTAVYIILRIIVIAIGVLAARRRDYESVFTCVLTLVLFMMPALVEAQFRIDLPDTLEVIILIFIFAAEILGELSCFFVRFRGWDTMLHTTSGFLYAAVGFSLVDIFNRNRRFRFELSPLFLAIVAFCFSMTIGVLWEFFEFAIDVLFHTDMQKDTIIHAISSVALDPTRSNIPVVISNIREVTVNGQSLELGGYLDIGLIDTMKDLFVNFIGAVVFSIIGYFYVKSRGASRFAQRFIPQVPDDAPPLLPDAADTPPQSPDAP